jgi:hypothetical protein
MDFLKAFLFSLLSFFMPIYPLLLLVGLFILFDTFLGVWSAKKRGEVISSRKLGNIIPKMLLYQLAVITGFVLDKWLLGEFISFLFTIEFLFTKLIAMTLVFIELVSIDENFRELTGKNLFKSFKQMITRASDIKDDINKL